MLTCQVNYAPESEQTNCLNNIPDHQGDVNTTDQLSTCSHLQVMSLRNIVAIAGQHYKSNDDHPQSSTKRQADRMTDRMTDRHVTNDN